MKKHKNTNDFFARSVQMVVVFAYDDSEKWVYFENPKRKKSRIDPGSPFTSTARQNLFDRETILCVWWDQMGVVYNELLKPWQTVNTKRYPKTNDRIEPFLAWKRPNRKKSYLVRLTLQTLLLPITICLHRWVTHLTSSVLVRTKIWKNGSQQKGKLFYWHGIHQFPERREIV